MSRQTQIIANENRRKASEDKTNTLSTLSGDSQFHASLLATPREGAATDDDFAAELQAAVPSSTEKTPEPSPAPLPPVVTTERPAEVSVADLTTAIASAERLTSQLMPVAQVTATEAIAASGALVAPPPSSSVGGVNAASVANAIALAESAVARKSAEGIELSGEKRAASFFVRLML